MSYVLDIGRGRAPAQKNPLWVGLYISFFPQLIAGPIVKYETVAAEIRDRRENWDDFSAGTCRFAVGFAKKVLLANTLAVAADTAFGAAELSVGLAWLGSFAYTFQIFFDFSGYSDMAIGLAQMFGFHFLENFNYPYISRSVTEFWREPGQFAGAASVHPFRGVAADRHLARCKLDVFMLGALLFRTFGVGKNAWA